MAARCRVVGAREGRVGASARLEGARKGPSPGAVPGGASAGRVSCCGAARGAGQSCAKLPPELMRAGSKLCWMNTTRPPAAVTSTSYCGGGQLYGLSR